jgi:rhamnogalacturonyl hydrolase YesR
VSSKTLISQCVKNIKTGLKKYKHQQNNYEHLKSQIIVSKSTNKCGYQNDKYKHKQLWIPGILMCISTCVKI